MLKDDKGQNLTGNARFFGYCVDLAEMISDIINVTYEFRLVKDNKFGVKGIQYNFHNCKLIV
jgi:hypothetical protein